MLNNRIIKIVDVIKTVVTDSRIIEFNDEINPEINIISEDKNPKLQTMQIERYAREVIQLKFYENGRIETINYVIKDEKLNDFIKYCQKIEIEVIAKEKKYKNQEIELKHIKSHKILYWLISLIDKIKEKGYSR